MWSTPGSQVEPPLHIVVIAIEKGAFKLPLNKIANFTYYMIYMNKYILSSQKMVYALQDRK